MDVGQSFVVLAETANIKTCVSTLRCEMQSCGSFDRSNSSLNNWVALIYLFIMNIVQSTHTQAHIKKENKKNYEIHKNSIKAFKAELLNKSNSK